MNARLKWVVLATSITLVLAGCGTASLTREQALAKSDYELCRVLYFSTWDEAAKAQAASILRSKGENCKDYFAQIAAQEQKEMQQTLIQRSDRMGM